MPKRRNCTHRARNTRTTRSLLVHNSYTFFGVDRHISRTGKTPAAWGMVRANSLVEIPTHVVVFIADRFDVGKPVPLFHVVRCVGHGVNLQPAHSSLQERTRITKIINQSLRACETVRAFGRVQAF